jgi:membrane-bound lytic murein transglycosylase D
MKKILLPLLILLSADAFAGDTIPAPDTTIYLMELQDGFEVNFDSLLNIYYINQAMEQVIDDTDMDIAEELPDFSDSVYVARLQAIPAVIDLSYNRLVKNYINVYTVKRREQVETMLGLSEYYFPMFEQIFDLYDVPYELKYLAIIESALNPRAVSRAGAVGIWQFMYRTGKVYGLRINSLVDERRDPMKATHAAAKFLKDLYGIYGDWTLALAAYNCGPGNVNKAIHRSGGKRDFWDIYYYLPRETRGYVPAFIAATYAMNYNRDHLIQKKQVEFSLYTDTLMVNEKLHLQQVSDVLGIPVKELRDLNPQYRYDILPATAKETYSLTIPVTMTSRFIDLQDSIFAYNDSVFFDPAKTTATPHKNVPGYRAELPSDKYDRLTYTVRAGDNLGFVADWYDVRLSDLKYWNNIYRNVIRTGQQLVIYKPKGSGAKYSPLNGMTFAEKQRFAGREVTPSAAAATGSREELSDGEYVLYTVKSGDTLWDIARKYPGVTETDIARWNNLGSGSRINPGQQLKIKKQG